MIKLGDKVKDKVTGFVGIVIAETHYLHGCTQFLVQPKINDKGEIPDNAWVDDPQLERIDEEGFCSKHQCAESPEGICPQCEIEHGSKPGGGIREHPR